MGRRRSLFNTVQARSAIPNETGQTRWRATLDVTTERRRKRRRRRSLFGILHAGGAIPNEVGPTQEEGEEKFRRRSNSLFARTGDSTAQVNWKSARASAP